LRTVAVATVRQDDSWKLEMNSAPSIARSSSTRDGSQTKLVFLTEGRSARVRAATTRLWTPSFSSPTTYCPFRRRPCGTPNAEPPPRARALHAQNQQLMEALTAKSREVERLRGSDNALFEATCALCPPQSGEPEATHSKSRRRRRRCDATNKILVAFSLVVPILLFTVTKIRHKNSSMVVGGRTAGRANPIPRQFLLLAPSPSMPSAA
jgi:hypothetical protein